MDSSSGTTPVYDFAVVGGGSAGLTAARFAARLGRKVVLVEANRVGGDCTWTGCVPSKALVRAARTCQEMREAKHFGVVASEANVNFPEVMSRLRAVIDEIYRPECPEALLEEGVETCLAPARFVDPHHLLVGDATIAFKRLLVATGARSSLPPINGLDHVNYQTYETIWDLETLPEHLLVIGGGAIGCELAQAFCRLGARVTLLESSDRILGQEEPEVSELMTRVMAAEGIEVNTNVNVDSISERQGRFRVTSGGHSWDGDRLLVSTGRQPLVEGMNLEDAGIAHSSRGIAVDRFLRTSQRHIYAAGDCTGGPQFTHYAGWQGFMAARNALLPGKTPAVKDTVPRATFTDPEIAHTGLTESQARERYGDSIRSTNWPLAQVERAIIDGTQEGFIKAITDRKGTILGVTIVGPGASEMVHHWILAMNHGLKLGDLANTLHVYPAYSMATMQMAAEERVSRLLAGVSGKVIKAWESLTH